MNSRVRIEDFDQAFVDCVNRYVYDREALLWEDSELDQEISKELGALYTG